MRKLFRWSFLLLALGSAAILGVALVNSARPLVPAAVKLDQQQRRWAHDWLGAHDPRRHRRGTRVALALSEHEANLLANYLIENLGPGRARVRFEPGLVRVQASVGLPWDPANAFVNMTAALRVEEGKPKVAEAWLAGLPVPAGLVDALAARALEGFTRTRLLQEISVDKGRALIVYEWHPGALDAIGTHLLPEDEQERLMAYQAEIVTLTRSRTSFRPILLTELLSRLLAKARSRSGDGDAAAENRAVLAVMAAYVNRRTIRNLDSTQASLPRPRFFRVTLRGRRDLAQHFTASAAIAAQGGSVFSDLVGLFKELTDSDGGSGFSFADLTADRAGVRLAALATDTEAGARRVQEAAARGLTEDDYMPQVKGLPEGISKRDFEEEYGGTQGRRYQALLDYIDRRIAARRLYTRQPASQAGPG